MSESVERTEPNLPEGVRYSGEGVFHFNATLDSPGQLVEFRRVNPQLIIRSMMDLGMTIAGKYPLGYVVVCDFREEEEPPFDESVSGAFK